MRRTPLAESLHVFRAWDDGKGDGADVIKSSIQSPMSSVPRFAVLLHPSAPTCNSDREKDGATSKQERPASGQSPLLPRRDESTRSGGEKNSASSPSASWRALQPRLIPQQPPRPRNISPQYKNLGATASSKPTQVAAYNHRTLSDRSLITRTLFEAQKFAMAPHPSGVEDPSHVKIDVKQTSPYVETEMAFSPRQIDLTSLVTPGNAVSMPEPPVAPERHVLPLPLMTMPEPQIPLQSTVEQADVSPHEASMIPQPIMAMPEPYVQQRIMPLPTTHHPPQSKGDMSFIPLPLPSTTFDPSSPHTPYTATAKAGTSEEDHFLRKTKQIFDLIPPLVRTGLSKEDLVRIVLDVLGEEREEATLPQHKLQEAAPPPASSVWPAQYPAVDGVQLPSNTMYQGWSREAFPAPFPLMDQALPATMPAVITANEWFRMQGGGTLPVGWTAEYDHASAMWFYTNHMCTPPVSVWQDPRVVVSMPLNPLPRFSPIERRDQADWLAKRFGGLEAHLQHEEGRRGPVAAEMDREREEMKQVEEAVLATKRASDQAHKAIARHDAEHFHSAQEEMVKARGVLDRLSHQAQLRNAAIPPEMQNYQGVTRGFDLDPAYLRPRTHYSDACPLPMASAAPVTMPGEYFNDTTTTSFKGRFMAKLNKAPLPPPPPPLAQLPHSIYMPTAYPLPPGVKYKASTTPTPYAIPEVCFAWDMLLRSRREPTAHYR
ncbi:hypothetical protein CBS101457_000343 [Exobasidium rhododendri]|nr:hypothetical protein CBS101457_000343 [Exobasidium rhododendri]